MAQKSPDSARIDHIVGLLTKSQSSFMDEMSKLNASLEKMVIAFADLSSKISDTNMKLDELKEICKPREYVVTPKE